MFSQWRGKRHYPFTESESAGPLTSGDGRLPRPGSAKGPLRINATMNGIRSKGIGKGRSRGPSRDDSISNQPDYDFAAGPRSGSRGAKSLEFGSGVVPKPRSGDDDTYANARSASVSLDVGPPVAVIGHGSSSPSLQTLETPKPLGGNVSHRQSPLVSIGEDNGFTFGDFEDFQAILELATSPLSDDVSNSPSGWTEATNLTTPEAFSPWSPQAKGFVAAARQPHRAAAPALASGKPFSSLHRVAPGLGGHRKRLSLAEAMAIFGQGSPAMSSPGDPAAAPRPLSHGRTGSASSFPETVSGPSSTHTDSREFSQTHAVISQGQSLSSLSGLPAARGPLNAVEHIDPQGRHGLGIFGGEESAFEGSESSGRSSRIKTSCSVGSSFADSFHRKSESYHSTQSSTNSWARSSRPVDIDRQSNDSADEHDALASRRVAGRIGLSDSEHSEGTAETSNELHELGPLSTIAEKWEGTTQLDVGKEPASARHDGRFQSASSFVEATSRGPPSSALGEGPKSPFSRSMETALSSMSPKTPINGVQKSPVARRKVSVGVLSIATPTFGCTSDLSVRSRGHQVSVSASGLSPSIMAASEDVSTPTPVAFELGTPRVHARETSALDRPRLSPSLSMPGSSSSGAKDPGADISSLTAPMPSAPFSGALLGTLEGSGGSGFSSLPASPLAGGNNGQAKQGIRRKARPAALTLKTVSGPGAHFPASAMSPGGALRGAPSPTRSRAPPPTAPPPDEPLPPLPPTPSLICPKSPLVLSRKSSAANLARAMAEAPPTPTLPRSASKTPVPPSPSLQKVVASPSTALADKAFTFPPPISSEHRAGRGSEKPAAVAAATLRGQEELKQAAARSDVVLLDPRRPEPHNMQVCGVGYSSSTEELDDSSVFQTSRYQDLQNVTRRMHESTGIVAASPTMQSDRESLISVDSGDGTVENDALLAVATTLTRVPSTAVRMAVYRPNARGLRVNSSSDGPAGTSATGSISVAVTSQESKSASPLALAPAPSASPLPSTLPSPLLSPSSAPSTSTPLNTVQRLKAQIESKTASSQPVSPAAKPAPLAPAAVRQSTAPPSAWTKRFAASASSAHAANASIDSSATCEPGEGARAATEGGHERLTDSALNVRDSVGRRASFGSLRTRRLEMVQDKADFAAASNEAKARIPKRTEGRFTDAFGEVAYAFKQLLAEKRMLEQLVRKLTPLYGLGENGQGLAEYIVSMNERLDSNAVEIRKLLDLLEQQRVIIGKVMDTHQVEIRSYLDEIDNLHRDLDEARHESEVHRSNAIRFNEELDRAHQEIVTAKAEALKARNGQHEEAAKREKSNGQLRAAREKAQTIEAIRTEKGALEAEIGLLRETLAKAGIQPPALQTDAFALMRNQQVRRNTSPDPGKHGEISTVGLSHGLNDDSHSPADSDDSTKDILGSSHTSRIKTAEQEKESTPSSSKTEVEVEAALDQLRRENADLKRSLVGKEAELVQARLSNADGAVAEWSDDASSSIPAGSETAASETASTSSSSLTELKRLRAQLSEQRTRESQIRTAYKILREELRKTQTGFQSERRRNSGFSLATGGTFGFGAMSSSAAPAASFGIDSEPPSPAEERRSLSSVRLKRLSLPVVNADPFGVAGPRSAAFATLDHSPSTSSPTSTSLSFGTPNSAGGYKRSSVYGASGLVASKRPISIYRPGVTVFPPSPKEAEAVDASTSVDV